MSPFSRTLLRYRAATASFACGLALLAVEGPAGFAWTLIVLSLGLAVRRPRAIAPLTDHPRSRRATTGGPPTPSSTGRRSPPRT